MSAELENKLISKLIDAKEIEHVWSVGLREEVFEVPINRKVFGWMMQYWLDNHMQAAPTRLVMEIQFPAVALESVVEESTDWLVDKLKRRFVWGQLQEITLACLDNGEEEPLAALQSLWQRSYDASQTVAPRHSRVNMRETKNLRREWYRRRTDQVFNGIPLGIPELDNHTRGVRPGELAVVAAYTKTGKSFFLVKTVVAAFQAGYTPLLMTLEQDTDEMQERVDAMFSGVSYERIQEGELSIPESTRLREAQDQIEEMGNLYVERPPRGERTVKAMASRARQLGTDILIIDQLSFIDAEREYRGDRATTQKHGDLIFELKDEISNDRAGKLPCLLAVQHNRDAARATQGGRGALHNLAHSSMIEQTADLVLGLWRNPEMRAYNGMGLDVMGSRRCDLRSYLLNWKLSDRTEISYREDMD